MKSISLTKEQRDKLLEMANHLWKKEDWKFYLNIPNDLNNDHTFVMGFIGDNDYIPNCDCYIHWFEFCMTHLVNRLYYPDNKGKRSTRKKIEYFFFQSFIDSIEGATAGYKHPIDYLYEEFLIIKQK